MGQKVGRAYGLASRLTIDNSLSAVSRCAGAVERYVSGSPATHKLPMPAAEPFTDTYFHRTPDHLATSAGANQQAEA
jgi:hypothetical protein